MLLSQDVQQPQDNNEPLWNQLPYPGIRGYEASRSQRRKDSKDAGSKYACNRCGKTYKATTSLSRHKRLECGVIPCEVCPICDRRFKHRFVLNSHIVGCQRKLRHIIQKTDDSPVFTEEREWESVRFLRCDRCVESIFFFFLFLKHSSSQLYEFLILNINFFFIFLYFAARVVVLFLLFLSNNLRIF